MTSDTPDLPLCKLSYHGDWTPLNQIFFSQCIQDSDEERSFSYQHKGRIRIDDDESFSELEVNMSNKLNSSDEQEKNIKRNISDKPNINSSDEYDDPHYGGRVRIDDDKSCSESEVPMSDEFNLVDEHQKNMHLKQSAVKCKKHTVNKNESSDVWEMHSNISNDYYDSSDSPDNYENNKPLKQSAVKYKKYTTNKNESSDEWEMDSNTSNDASSDSSDNYEVSAKKKKNEKSKVPEKKKQKSKSFQLSEYEKMVQKNRDEQITFLKSLKIFEAKEDFKKAIKTLKPKRVEKEQNIKRKNFRNLENCLTVEVDKAKKVRRQSSRQKNLQEKKERLFASSRSHNKLLPDISFEEALKSGQVYHDFISEISDSECNIPQILKNDFKSHFERMTLQESEIISRSTVTSMTIHESQEKIIICAGNSKGEIIFWHVNSDYDFCTFQIHLQTVSCLKFNPYSPNEVVSSSFDGTMYRGDFEKRVFYQMFKAESCNYFDFFSPTSYLVTHGIKYVSIIDIRTHRKTSEKRHKCNEDAVKTVSLHPINKNYFISAHEKGAIRLWDLRKLQNEPVFEVYCKGENLISSSFSPVTGNSVLVTMSDTIGLLDSSSRGLNKEFKLKKSIEITIFCKINGGGRIWQESYDSACWNKNYKFKLRNPESFLDKDINPDFIEHENFTFTLSPFQATWLPNTDDTFVIGSRLNPGRIEIFDDKLCNVFNFTDKRCNCIAFVNTFHSSLPFLASASRKRASIFSEIE
ncbi:unnamed protein product [Larinioides sclopetarius]|uniref:WD repeat-containing protein 76 n=1 Tax=Larinioides sclopetarius TaxID=280406 RepID=A0AAV2BYI9_9ARAC